MKCKMFKDFPPAIKGTHGELNKNNNKNNNNNLIPESHVIAIELFEARNNVIYTHTASMHEKRGPISVLGVPLSNRVFR